MRTLTSFPKRWFSSLEIQRNWHGRLSLPKIDLWLWIHERKENILKNIKNIFIAFITTPRHLWIVCFNSSFWAIDAHVVRSFLIWLFCIFYSIIEDILSWIKRIVCWKIICLDQQVAYVVTVMVLRKRHQKDETQEI